MFLSLCPGVCSRPERIENAVLRSGELQDSYPVGTNLTYRCIPGYQLISGTVPQITCSNASQWLPETPQFCEGEHICVDFVSHKMLIELQLKS